MRTVVGMLLAVLATLGWCFRDQLHPAMIVLYIPCTLGAIVFLIFAVIDGWESK